MIQELKDAKDRRVVYDSPITRLVREGEEITATKVHLFLLNDLMLIATNPAGINYQMQMMMMQYVFTLTTRVIARSLKHHQNGITYTIPWERGILHSSWECINFPCHCSLPKFLDERHRFCGERLH